MRQIAILVFHLLLFVPFGEALSTTTDCQIVCEKVAVSEPFHRDSLKSMARSNWDKSPNTALNYARRLLVLSCAQGNAENVAEAYFIIGSIQRRQGIYDSALMAFYNVHDWATRCGLSDKLAKSLVNIGLVHGDMENFKKALKFHDAAEEIYRNRNDSLGVAFVYNNLGVLFFRQDKWTEALDYLKKSLRLKRSLGITGLRLNYNNLGRVYYKLNQYDTALYYHKLALSFIKESHQDYYKAETLSGIADIYLAKGETAQSLSYYQHAYDKAVSLGANEMMDNILSGLRESYVALNAFEKAYQTTMLQKIYQDSLYGVQKNIEVAKVERQYNVKAKQQEIEFLTKQHDLEIGKRNTIIYLVSVICFLLLLTAFMMMYAYKRNKKAAHQLQVKNEELGKQKLKQLIKDQELKSAQAAIEAQEKERLRIARDLHDGIGGVLASIKLEIFRVLEASVETDDNPVLIKVDKAYEEVRAIAHNLAPPRLKNALFTEVLHSYLNDVKVGFTGEINMNLSSCDDLNRLTGSIQVEIYRIVQELLLNAIKHSQASLIEIQLLKFEQFINIIVEDNGIGFEAIEEDSGMGLLNIRDRLKLLKGNFDIDSVPKRGTTVNIDIPVSCNDYLLNTTHT